MSNMSQRYSKEVKEFILGSKGKNREIAAQVNAHFNIDITTRAVRAVMHKGGPYRGRHHYTREQVEFLLAATDSLKAIAASFKTKYETEISTHSIKIMKQTYGPGDPLPTKGNLNHEQYRFVLNSIGNSAGEFRTIANDFNARFRPVTINARGVRHIKERYGPGAPLP